MSAHSCTSSSDLIQSGYARILAVAVLVWFMIFLGFIWGVDPYGVSPIKISIPKFNTLKVARLDIDRQIKPFEVWWKQPKTVFLGTSRIHQSMDPAVMSGTKFAPAYNASVPASHLVENHRLLELYFKLNPNIKHVVLEAFLYAFIYPQSETAERNISEVAQIGMSLNFSLDAILASFKTIYANHRMKSRPAFVDNGGNWVRSANFNTKQMFNHDLNIKYIMATHRNIPNMIVQPTAIDALNAIVALCKKNGATLTIVMTPNYPWDDYRLLSLGYWPLLQDWHRKMTNYDNVVSFSQYNDVITEQVSAEMSFWNDPIHFSRKTGTLMLRVLSGQTTENRPKNFAQKVTVKTVASILSARKVGLQNWIEKTPGFAEAFEEGKRNAGGPVDRRP